MPLNCNEIQRLFITLIDRTTLDAARCLGWSLVSVDSTCQHLIEESMRRWERPEDVLDT